MLPTIIFEVESEPNIKKIQNVKNTFFGFKLDNWLVI